MEVARSRLALWLAARMPEASEVRVSPVTGPPFTGFSNETLLFDASWSEGSTATRAGFAARVKPRQHTIFLEDEFDTQYKVIEVLGAKTDIPVPPVLFFEEDPAVLGAPFFLMSKIDGEVPCDNPPYTMGGWPFDAAPDDQRRLWWSGLETMSAIHGLDWRSLGLDFVDRPSRGATGIEQQLGYYREYAAWVTEEHPEPLLEQALDWLDAHVPSHRGPDQLCWGDSRIGNMIFEDYTCRAVLDWEMVTPGDPVQDLAWFLYLDRHHSDGLGMARLEGFPSREQTVARWEQLTGKSASTLDYYEVFAAFRFAVVMVRIGWLMIRFDLLPPDSDYASNNTATQMLARIMADQCC
jgi:aminoglycoside phosphotransferase (APT) family kinase protein